MTLCQGALIIMDTNNRQEVTIEVNAAVTVLFAKFVQLNIDGLIDFAKENVGMTDDGADEFKHIANELLEKSMKVAVP